MPVHLLRLTGAQMQEKLHGGSVCSNRERRWAMPRSTQHRTPHVPVFATPEISLSYEGHTLGCFTLALIVGSAWCCCLPSSNVDELLMLVCKPGHALSRTSAIHFILLNLLLKFLDLFSSLTGQPEQSQVSNEVVVCVTEARKLHFCTFSFHLHYSSFFLYYS